jgi:hypothetical protein
MAGKLDAMRAVSRAVWMAATKAVLKVVLLAA